jgi:acyl-CoA synthetase (NDP forming)
VANPVDMLASAPAEHYGRALETLLQDEQVDSVMTIFIPPLVTDPDAVAAAVSGAAAHAGDKTVLGIFMRADGAPRGLSPVPCYAFPESAAAALARVTLYGEWRRKPAGSLPVLQQFDADAAKRIVAGALQRGGGWLAPSEVQELLRAIHVQTAPVELVSTVEDAVAAAVRLGLPVALKAVGPTMLHKTERQAVRLNLVNEQSVRETAHDFERRFHGELAGLLVQRMVGGGVEMLVGALHDPTFGPLVACGSGGVLVDLLGDTAFRLHPITGEDAAEMVGELRGVRLLRGYRGAPPADERALRDVLLRVSALLTHCPEIHELDMNPVKVLESGACVLDARVRVEPAAAPLRTRRVEY